MENVQPTFVNEDMLSYEGFKNHVMNDYRLAVVSRETSLLGRREVLTGKAKFGIFGDGKELPQIAAAKFFKEGDFRAGYYRDQTFAFATGVATVEQFFSQLFADSNPDNDVSNAGRQMVSHFATRMVDDDGNWLDLTKIKNHTSDMAPTASQIPRAMGLAFASKCFRNVEQLKPFTHLSNNGNEVCFCTIGDASTSEGHFWEIVNAAGVMQIPMAIFVWDDGYGISVPTSKQTVKASISAALQGLQKQDNTNGIDIYEVKAWDYAGMCEVFEQGIDKIRNTHIPALFHVQEATQPQGHSTSGSHARYKTPEHLAWEREWDCNKKFREWIIANDIATNDELNSIEHEAKLYVKESKNRAWSKFENPVREEIKKAAELIEGITVNDIETYSYLQTISADLQKIIEPWHKDVLHTLSLAMEAAPASPSINEMQQYYNELLNRSQKNFHTYLYNQGTKSALNVQAVSAVYTDDSPTINGYEILNHYFDALFTNNPLVFAFGEDVGVIGDVNQGFAGLQKKHGEARIFDTGIREISIMGKAIGMSLRGLRPIAEVQYLDYLLYGLQTLSDDAATTHFRTYGKQSCPLIVRTRGHRLEGIWHSGSPMGILVNALRGLYVCVPRNMVQTAGMYNTLLKSNDPALVIECLNGYRLKEKLPDNILEFTVPMGIPEIIKEGNDVTIVSYGSMLRIIQEAAERLEKQNISCEVIDVQTLLPFDINHQIVESLKKTNRILFVDEDVPGGASAYMFNKVMEEQNGYKYLDVSPRTLTSKEHRPTYGSDGDYFSKPNAEAVIAVIKDMMKE